MSNATVICPKCEKKLKDSEQFAGEQVECPHCQHVFTASKPHKLEDAETDKGTDKHNVKDIAEKLSGHLTDLAGVEKLEGFSIKEFFSDVFSKHSKEEMEEYFTIGSTSTTPLLEDVDTSWPRPWVFFKTLIGSLSIYILFLMAWKEYHNFNLIPGMVIMGSFAVPIATLIFFFEVNVRRNVSLYQIIRLLFSGGILSIIFSLIFYGIIGDWIGASLAGLIEEPGKILVLLMVINIPKYKYRLNGLLFGAAVGAGSLHLRVLDMLFIAG